MAVLDENEPKKKKNHKERAEEEGKERKEETERGRNKWKAEEKARKVEEKA